jgi:DNA-directed RNA polymerase subunit RPC12/RpoP
MTPGTTSFTCLHCGKAHLIRKEAGAAFIESYARCPKCGRNDEVKKIVSIVNSQTQTLNGTTIQPDQYQDKDGHWHSGTSRVAFNGTQMSVLAERLSPLPQPKIESVWNCSGGLFLILMVISIAYGGSGIAMNVWVIPSIGAFFLALLFLSLAIKYTRANNQQRKTREEELPTLMEGWRKSMQKWEQLYYCLRDDCIFDPAENNAFSPDRLHEYLKQNS